MWLQQLVKQRSKVVPFTETPELFHLVSGVSGSNNIADLGTKRLGKTRLAELMNFCNLGYIVGDVFAPFSEHVSETKQVVALVKSFKKGNATVASIIAHASLIRAPWVRLLWTIAVPVTSLVLLVYQPLQAAVSLGTGY